MVSDNTPTRRKEPKLKTYIHFKDIRITRKYIFWFQVNV